jgi:hypothetical protein
MFLGDRQTPSELNSQNSGTLLDGQFLIMGSNNSAGGSDTATYTQPANTVYENGVRIDEGLDFRSRHVYRAQLTGAPGNAISVNLRIDRGDFFYVLVSTDSNFDPTRTKAYPVSGGLAHGVEIEGGAGNPHRYITFAGRHIYPGGVSKDLRLWLNAGDFGSFMLSRLPKGNEAISGYHEYERTGEGTPVTLDNINAVQEWRDIARNITYRYIPGAPNRKAPVYRDRQIEMNYHPSVHFWGASDNSNVAFLKNHAGLLSAPQPKNGRHTAVFVVNNAPPRGYQPGDDNDETDRSYYMGFGHATGDASYNRYDPDYGIRVVQGEAYTIMNTFADQKRNSGDAATPVKFNAGATSVVTYRTYTPVGGNPSKANIIFNIDGQPSSAVEVDMSSANVRMNMASTLGISYSPNRQLRGLMSEIIIFEDTVSADDLKKIESYLAIKYGVTLKESPSANYDYRFSDGNIYWNGNGVDALWHNSVAAVIRDDKARLYNRQSHSTGAGSILHIGIAGTRLGEGIEDVGDFGNNMEAIVWGSNGASGFSRQLTGEHCGKFEYVFKRIWKVRKHTLNDRPVELLVGAQNNESKTIGGGVDGQYYSVLNGTDNIVMLVADHPDKLDPENPAFDSPNAFLTLPMNYICSENQCRYTFAANDTYITFAYKPDVKGCYDSTEFTGGSKEFKWTQWTRQDYNTVQSITKQDFDLGDDVKVATQIDYDGDIVNPAGYPHAVITPVGGSLQINRRGGTPESPVMPGSAVTVTVRFNRPVMPGFYLSDLDGWNGAYEQVEIAGKCNGISYQPVLSYAHANGEAGSWYIIDGNRALVRRSEDLSEQQLEGRLNVRFTAGVTEIRIRYSIRNKINAGFANRLFISPITINRTTMPPPVNEHGLAFTKDVNRRNFSICDSPEYLFEIINANCDTKTVNLYDTLPEGLKWEPDLLMLDSLNRTNGLLSVDTSTTADGRHVLKIMGLAVAGSKTTVVSATVQFSPNAVTQSEGSKTFCNHAVVEYILKGKTVNLFSVDRYNTASRDTPFDATWQPHQSEAAVHDLRIQICTSPAREINLTAFTDSIDGGAHVKWERANAAAPHLSDGILNTENIPTNGSYPTFSYKYTVTAKCYSSSAMAYVRVLSDRILYANDTVAICRQQAGRINVGSILGTELGGTWSYPNDPDKAVSNNARLSAPPSQYTGAMLFDGTAAYADATHPKYSITYRGLNCKQFVFDYSPPAGNSCVTQRRQIVILIY